MTETINLSDENLIGLSEDAEIALRLEQLGAAPATSLRVTPPDPSDPNLVIEGPDSAKRAAELWGSERAKLDPANQAALQKPTKVWAPGKTEFKGLSGETQAVSAAESISTARREASIDELIAAGYTPTQARELASQDPAPPTKLDHQGNILDSQFVGSERKLTKGGQITEEQYMASVDEHRKKQAEQAANYKLWAEQQLLASKTPDELVEQAMREFKDLPSTEEEKSIWLHNLERNDSAAFERFMKIDDTFRAKNQAAFEQQQAEVQAQPQPVEQPQPAQPAQSREFPMEPSAQAKIEGALLVRNQLDQLAAREFPDVRSVQDFQVLAKVNPQRATRLLQMIGAYQQVQNHAWSEYQAAQRQAEAVHAQAQQIADYVATQNNLAEVEIPELRAGGRTAAAFKRAAIETMHSLGYDDATIAQAMDAGQIGLREQKLIAAATRERLAEQARSTLNEKRARPQVPPPIRPGVSLPVPTGSEADVARADQRFEQAKARGASVNMQARLMAEALAAARRAATGTNKPAKEWM